MPRDAQWFENRDRAKVLVRVLAKFEMNFNDPHRREEPLNSAELRTLDSCAEEALRLLGDSTLVLPMINNLQADLRVVAETRKGLPFDAAYRHVGPILAAVEGTYDLSGSSGSRPSTKSGKNSAIVARIDDEDL